MDVSKVLLWAKSIALSVNKLQAQTRLRQLPLRGYGDRWKNVAGAS